MFECVSSTMPDIDDGINGQKSKEQDQGRIQNLNNTQINFEPYTILTVKTHIQTFPEICSTSNSTQLCTPMVFGVQNLNTPIWWLKHLVVCNRNVPRISSSRNAICLKFTQGF